MEVIQSFTIDHTKLEPGIYVSREDKEFITFDLRFTAPNREPAIAPAAMHTLEHLMATWFRNSEIKDSVVYVGPMGCLTGMYLVLRSDDKLFTPFKLRELVIQCLEWIQCQTEVPANTPATCGNYLLHDLPMAKWEARRYRFRLVTDFHCTYSKLNVALPDGKRFADA